MDSQKIYLLAEVTVLPEFLEDVKGALKQALIPTLQEAGCEGMFETSREGDPHKLVFFEIFSSSAAHKFHLEQDYMKRLFTGVGGQAGWSPDHDQVECTLTWGLPKSLITSPNMRQERTNRKLFRTKGVFLCGSCNS
jgi:quinol monooxygenase YgiN